MSVNEAQLKELVSKMTLEEKVSQLSYNSPAIARLGIHEYNWWNEALHGIARAGLATVFPQAIALSATFDVDLVRRVADAVSTEGRAKYNEASKNGNRGQYYGLTFWTPNVNIFRDPRWGRGQETYGEDPYLTSCMGLAYMKGLQGEDGDNLKTAACAKHFAVHSGPEKLRHTFDAQVSKKDLWETYLPAFQTLVENGVESVMGAYNRTLGEPCCGSFFLLKDILRDKWGFKGHVVSDCWAIRDFHEFHKVTADSAESAALALNAGCDLNCGCTYPFLTAAYEKGLVSMPTIDRALLRLLRTKQKLGLLGGKTKWDGLGRRVINSKKHQKLALEAAHKSIVLLKNDGVLPLGNEPQRVLIVGPSAANIHAMLGNYHGVAGRVVTLLEGLAEKMRSRYALQVEYRMGCLQYQPNDESARMQDGVAQAGAADVVIACFGLDSVMEGEEGDTIASASNGDRESIELPAYQLSYLRALRQNAKKIVLVLTGGSAISFPPDIADAVIYAWYGGERGGEAVADIIFGDVVPSGKLPITIPASTADLPPYDDYSMKGRTYRYMEKAPLYPFGYGLSYTTFRYDSIKVTENALQTGGSLHAVVQVSNTGNFDAEEVVQLYIKRDDRAADEPLCALKGFKRLAIKAGRTKEAHFTLTPRDFETVGADGEGRLLAGGYTLIVSTLKVGIRVFSN